MSKKETTTTFKADITELNKAFKEASQQIKIANSEFKAASAGLNDWANNADGVSAKLKQLNSNLESEKQKLASLEKQLARTAEEYGENSKEVQDMTIKVNNQKARVASTEKQIGNYNQKLKDLTEKAKETDPELEALSKSIEATGESADKSHPKLEKFGSILGKGAVGAAKIAGKAVLGIAAAMGAIGAASVKAGASFDAQMSTVQSISGAAGNEFEALKEKAKEMGATTSFSATESAQALEYMAMAGWDTQQMTDGLAGVMNLAAASGESLATTSDIVTDAMTAFGMKAEESEYFSDVLAKTASSANTNVSMMGETFKYVAPLAGAMGYNIEDMSVAIGLMANSGIKGSQAGTSLRGVITNLASPSKEVADTMKALGISLTDSDGNMKTFRDTLGNLRESFSELDETQRTAYASTIAGKNGMSGLLAMINSSDDDFEKLTKEIENCSGAAKEMADVRLDNLQGDITLFKSALEGAEVAISDQLSPVLRDFVQEATEMIPDIQGDIADLGGAIANTASGLMPIVKDIFSYAAPLISDIGNEIADILPFLSDIVKDILPVAKKALEMLIKNGLNIIKKLLPSISKLIEAVTSVLEPLLDVLEPVLDFITKIATAITGSLIDAVAATINSLTGQNGVIEKTAEKYSELSKSEQEVIDKAKEFKQASEELNTKRTEMIDGANAEYGYYQNLADELSTIVDKNGKIKEGYEDRATVITTTLNDALGLEIQTTDGVIENYQKLQEEIKKTIELKKGQAILDSMEGDYTEALMKSEELVKAKADANYKLAINTQKLKDVESELEQAEAELAQTDKNGLSYIYVEKKKKVQELQGAQQGLTERIETQKKAVKDLDDEYVANQGTIENYGQLQEDVLNGHFENINQDLSMMKKNFVTAEYASEESLLRQTREFENTYQILKQQAQDEGSDVTDAMVQNYYDMYYKSAVELQKLNGMSMTEIGKLVRGLNDYAPQFGESGRYCSNSYTSSFLQAYREAEGGILEKMSSTIAKMKGMMSDVSINANASVNLAGAPKTATGGIVTRAQTRIVGEDGAEAIVPLEKNTKWIDLVAARILEASGSRFSGGQPAQSNVTNNYFTQNNTSPKALSDTEIYRQTHRLLKFNSR